MNRIDKKESLIAPNQAFGLILMTLLGVRLLSLASEVAQVAKQDAWIATLIAGLLATGAACIYALYSLRFPKHIFTETLHVVFGRPLGHIMNSILVIWLIVMSGLTLREFSATIRITILDRTPPWAIWGVVLVVTSFLVVAGIETMARLYDFLLLISLGIITFLVTTSWQVVDFRNLRPILDSEPLTLIRGVFAGLRAFMQYAIIGMLLPFSRTTKGYVPRVLLAMGIMTTIYTLIVLQCIGAFGAAETAYLVVPILTLVKSVDLPFILFERLELFLMLAWIPIAFTSVATHQFVATLVSNRDWGLSSKSWRWLTWGIGAAIFLTAALPLDVAMNAQLSNLVDNFTIGLGFILVPGTYLVAVIRGKRGDGREAIVRRATGH